MSFKKNQIMLVTSILLATLILGMPIQMVNSQPNVLFAATYLKNRSLSDESRDNEVWVSIHKSDGTITHHQVTDTGWNEYDPSIAMAPNGNIIVAWYVNEEGVFYAVLYPSGTLLPGFPTILSTRVDDKQPCVAVTPNGVVFVVWDGELTGPDVVAYKTMDVNGGSVSSEKQISGIDSEPNEPTIAASIQNPNDNRVVIAWNEETGNGNDLVYTILDSNENILVAKNKDIDVDDANDINVAILPNGNVVLVWRRMNDIGYTIRNTSGGEVVPVNILANNDKYRPAVSATPEGYSVIVWEEIDSIYYYIIDGNGGIKKDVTPLSGMEWDPDVVVDTNGNVVIIGEGDIPQSQNGRYAILNSVGGIEQSTTYLTDADEYDVNLIGRDGLRQVAVNAAEPEDNPVGGIYAPTDKLNILTPFIALVGLIGAVTTIFAVRRWRKD